MANFDISRLLTRSMLPTFTLQTVEGGEFSTWSAKGSKNLVVVVIGKTCSPECRILLARIVREYKMYKDLNAEVVVIMRMIRETADEVRFELGIPFPVLVDVDGRISGRLSHQVPAIFVTDRYGEIVAEYLGEDALKVKQEEILARVELNELECPE